MLTFKEYIAERVKPSDFKKGDIVKWGSSFSSREKDMKGEVIGFKDHEDYKNGYLVIKGDDKKEYKLIFSTVQKIKDVTEKLDDSNPVIKRYNELKKKPIADIKKIISKQ